MKKVPKTKLKPLNQIDKNYGVKCVLYGAPGTGKTPIATTAPSPVILITEPGTKSVRKLSTPAWEGFAVEDIVEFFDWVKLSNDAKKFDTIVIDSISEVCEIFLKKAVKENKHGLKAYGEMSEQVYSLCWDLFHLQQKHVVLIGKEQLVNVQGENSKRVYFPGKELNLKIPHLYDEILQLTLANIPPHGEVLAIRTRSNFEAHARDRSGMLNEFEPPNLANLINKCMKG